MSHPRRAWLLRRTVRRTGPGVLFVLLLVLGTGLVGLSPIGLGWFRGDKDDWERLSFIGQTYGAASAVLSAFALVGIAITLVLQAREVKVGREQGQRILHADLLKMAMENPLYRRAWGPLPPGRDRDTDLQQIYVNLIISEWQTSFELKTTDESLLRAVAASLFRGEPGRRFWAEARERRMATSVTRRERRFHRIIDEEYQAAQAQGPPLPDREVEPRGSARRDRVVAALAGVVGGVGALLCIQRLLRSRRAAQSGRRDR